MPNKLFILSRRRLAISYTGVMAVILTLCGLTIYRLINDIQRESMKREVDGVATAVQITIAPALQQPGQIEPNVSNLLPNLCLQNFPCSSNVPIAQSGLLQAEKRVLSRIYKGSYCIRLRTIVDGRHLQDQPLGIAQFSPRRSLPCDDRRLWSKQRDRRGRSYYITKRKLYTSTQQYWGSLEVAKRLDEQSSFLFSVQLILFTIVGSAIALTAVASWGLAEMAVTPIRQAYEQIQQFTADAAHELRTPITSLRAMVQSALKVEHLSTEDMQSTLGVIDRQSLRLSQLVQSLLLLCQLDQQEVCQPASAWTLNELVKELVADFQPLALSGNLTLISELPQEALVVKGHREQVYRLLANLLSNALHYTPAGGRVVLRLERHQRQGQVQVEDTGIGMTAAEQTQIFTRFFRSDRSRSRHRGGAGLGLAIAQSIAHAHRGSLQVRSELGQGSTFTLRLPLQQRSHSASL